MNKIDRRTFLKYSAGAIALSSLNSCANTTGRYLRPEQLTKKNEKFLIKNAKIIDVRYGRILPQKNILISNGKIIKLLHNWELKKITFDRGINLNGAYAMPGLINSHCHITMPGGYGFNFPFLFSMRRQAERNAEECIKHGVTTIRDLGSPLRWMDVLKNKINKNKIISPRIFTCCGFQINGGYLKEFKLFNSKRYWNHINSIDDVETAVKIAVDGGAHFIKLFHQQKHLLLPGKQIPVMDKMIMRKICETAAKYDKPIAMHHVDHDGFEQGLEIGANTLEHMVTDRVLKSADIRKIIDKKIYIIPTTTVGFALSSEKYGDPNWGKGETSRIQKLRKHRMEKILKEFLEPEVYASTLQTYKKYQDPKSFEKKNPFMWIDPSIFNAAAVNGAENCRILYKAGAKLGVGNDGGAPFIPSGAIPLEMELMEIFGIRTRDVIKMTTINNAEILRMQDKIGSIEEGKLADIAIYDKNPLITVKNLEKPMLVFLEGDLMYQNSGKALLE